MFWSAYAFLLFGGDPDDSKHILSASLANSLTGLFSYFSYSCYFSYLLSPRLPFGDKDFLTTGMLATTALMGGPIDSGFGCFSMTDI